MSVPKDLLYTKSHEWVRQDGNTAVVGVSHYAQEQLGEVVFVELPDVDTEVDTGDELGTIESVKAVSEFYAPVAGTVVEVNEALEDDPGLINTDPYGDGWLVKVETTAKAEDLLDAAAYETFVAEEAEEGS